MPESIVDVLEMIEIEHDERQRCLESAGPVQFAFDGLQSMLPIETACEWIADASRPDVLIQLFQRLRGSPVTQCVPNRTFEVTTDEILLEIVGGAFSRPPHRASRCRTP